MYKAFLKNPDYYYTSKNYKALEKLIKEPKKEKDFSRQCITFMYPINDEIYLCITQGVYLLAFMVELDEKLKEKIINAHKDENDVLNRVNILSSNDCIIFEFDENNSAPVLENAIPTEFDKEIKLYNITYKETDSKFSINVCKIFKEFKFYCNIYYLKLIFEAINKVLNEYEITVKKSHKKITPFYFENTNKTFFALLMPFDEDYI